MSQFLTQLATMQLELILPTDAPAGCLHYSRAEVNQFIMHSMSYSDSDDADASLLHLLRMLDYFYLSQTVSDPYSEFLAMHWAKGVTWEAYVLSIIHFAQKYRYFQKLEEHGHQGSALSHNGRRENDARGDPWYYAGATARSMVRFCASSPTTIRPTKRDKFVWWEGPFGRGAGSPFAIVGQESHSPLFDMDLFVELERELQLKYVGISGVFPRKWWGFFPYAFMCIIIHFIAFYCIFNIFIAFHPIAFFTCCMVSHTCAFSRIHVSCILV